MNNADRYLADAIGSFRMAHAHPDDQVAELRGAVERHKSNWKQALEEARQAYAETAIVSEPSEKVTLLFDGPLLAMPHNADQIESAREIDLVFRDACGGCSQTAFELIDKLESSSAFIRSTITGRCMSSHALLFLAGHERVMREGASLMIHGPASAVVGTMKDIDGTLKMLAGLAYRFVDYVVRRTGIDSEVVEQWVLCGDDFWFSDAEAVCLGFVNGARPTPAG